MKQGTGRTGLAASIVVLAGLGVGLAACGGSESGSKPAAQSAAGGEQAKGAKIFKLRCAICHGDTGHGDGMGSAGLPVKPRNLTLEPYKYVDIAGSASEIEALTKYIATGRQESGMPGYRDLVPGATEEQVQSDLHALATFVASIRPKPDFVEAPPAAPANPPADKPADKPADNGG